MYNELGLLIQQLSLLSSQLDVGKDVPDFDLDMLPRTKVSLVESVFIDCFRGFLISMLKFSLLSEDESLLHEGSGFCSCFLTSFLCRFQLSISEIHFVVLCRSQVISRGRQKCWRLVPFPNIISNWFYLSRIYIYSFKVLLPWTLFSFAEVISWGTFIVVLKIKLTQQKSLRNLYFRRDLFLRGTMACKEENILSQHGSDRSQRNYPLKRNQR